jgi:hypothetical protein
LKDFKGIEDLGDGYSKETIKTVMEKASIKEDKLFVKKEIVYSIEHQEYIQIKSVHDEAAKIYKCRIML